MGCGRGILLALLAERARGSGHALQLHGIEGRTAHAEVARAALGADARIDVGDLTTSAIPPAEAICLIDVLHYLPEAAQGPLLERIARALPPEGVLYVREIDQAAGFRGWLARSAEHLMSALRGEPTRAFAFRSASAWRRLLAEAGLTVEERSMDEGTPFANVLLVGRRT